MRVEPRRLIPADTTYPDWHGTTIAEDSFIIGSNDLYELAGLDHDHWTILGLDVSGFSHGDPPRWDIRVYAHNKAEHGVSSYEDLKQLEADRGAIPVREIALQDVEFDDVIKSMKLVGMQFLRRDFDALEVVEVGDYPEQE